MFDLREECPLHRAQRPSGADLLTPPSIGRSLAILVACAPSRPQFIPAMMRRSLLLVIAAGIATGFPPVAKAAVIGNWDFAGGSLAPAAGTISLSELRTKPYYTTYGGSAGIPAVEFVSTGTFGIVAPGGSPQTVMRVPNTAGFGPMGGLIAEFPRITNATTTSLNRYTIIMDVLVRQSAYDAAHARASGKYISLFQTAPGSDGDLFIDVRDTAGLPGADRPLGIGGVYGGDVVADQWHRLAWVASLDAATNQPRFRAFVNGLPASTLVWDTLQAEGIADNDSVKLDLTDPLMPAARLATDGRFSIYTLGQITSQNPANTTGPSAFFLFNDNSNELGETFVANLQFRDDALSADDILALGGATGGLIAVPEPATAWLALSALILIAAGAYRAPSLRAARA